MTAGHLAAQGRHQGRRPDLPGRPLARDHRRRRGRRRRHRCATASGPRSTSTGCELARDDDFVGVQNYERVPYDGDGAVPPPEGAASTRWARAIEPLSLGGAVRYAYEVAGVPVLVTEHGMSHRTTTPCAPPSSSRRWRGLLDVMDEGVPVLGYLPLDADGQLRVDLRLRPPARPARGRPRDLRADGEAECRRLRRDRAGPRRRPEAQAARSPKRATNRRSGVSTRVGRASGSR